LAHHDLMLQSTEVFKYFEHLICHRKHPMFSSILKTDSSLILVNKNLSLHPVTGKFLCIRSCPNV